MTKLSIQVFLPLGCALLFIVFILFLGRIALWTTILPVLGGAAFFVLSIFDEGMGWPLFICIALAFLAVFVYTATVSGMIRTKWLLALLFALILAYQIVRRAIPEFGDTEKPISFVDGMALLSELGMIFSMLLASLAFRRRKRAKEEPELPKIKDPVVIPPAGQESADAPVIAQEPSHDLFTDAFFTDAAPAPEQVSDAFAPDAGESDPPETNSQE